MTINEAQGQSINNLGVYLPQPVIICCSIESRYTSENKRLDITDITEFLKTTMENTRQTLFLLNN